MRASSSSCSRIRRSSSRQFRSTRYPWKATTASWRLMAPTTTRSMSSLTSPFRLAIPRVGLLLPALDAIWRRRSLLRG